MEFPIRCFTCGRPIAQDYEKYLALLEEGKSPKEALDQLGIKRYCCRRMFLTHITIEEIKYYKRV